MERTDLTVQIALAHSILVNNCQFADTGARQASAHQDPTPPSPKIATWLPRNFSIFCTPSSISALIVLSFKTYPSF
jgi:hypothetical protein